MKRSANTDVLCCYISGRYCLPCISGTRKSGSSHSSRSTPRAKLREDIHLPAVRVARKQQTSAGTDPSSPMQSRGESQLNGSGKSRPKRQAALIQPDYKALHNVIPTSTNKWLDLIADPGKTGRTISDRKPNAWWTSSYAR